MTFSSRLILALAFTAIHAIKLDNENLVWSELSPMPTKRSDMTATYIDEAETVFVAGGCATDQAVAYEGDFNGDGCRISDAFESYKPESDQWITLNPLPNKRNRHAATALGKKIYLIGGYTELDDDTQELLEQIDVYDTETEEWSTIPSLPQTTSDAGAFTINSQSAIYYTGGYDKFYNTSTTTYKFVPGDGTDMWHVAGLGMEHGRGDFGVVSLTNEDQEELAYSFGGFSLEGDTYVSLSVMEKFNPTTDTWTVVRDEMDEERGDKAVVAYQGNIVILGGQQSGGVNDAGQNIDVMLDDVEAYDIMTDDWFKVTDLPTPRIRFAAAAHEKNIYVFGGQGETVERNGEFFLPLLDTVEKLEEPDLEETSNVTGLMAFFSVFVCIIHTLVMIC